MRYAVASPSSAHPVAGTGETFPGLLATFLVMLSMFLPAGEIALLAADGPDAAPCVAARRFPGGARCVGYDAGRGLSESVDDEGLDGGSDDDDFRPSTDRATAPAERHAAALLPLSVRCLGVAPSSIVLPVQLSLRHGTHPDALIAVARASPALDGPVQFLC